MGALARGMGRHEAHPLSAADDALTLSLGSNAYEACYAGLVEMVDVEGAVGLSELVHRCTHRRTPALGVCVHHIRGHMENASVRISVGLRHSGRVEMGARVGGRHRERCISVHL